jgi:hypothetical protein
MKTKFVSKIFFLCFCTTIFNYPMLLPLNRRTYLNTLFKTIQSKNSDKGKEEETNIYQDLAKHGYWKKGTDSLGILSKNPNSQYLDVDTLLWKDDASKNAAYKLWSDLELIMGSGDPEKNLLTVIDRTKTAFGKAELAKMLVTPTNNMEILKRNQTVLATIHQDDELFNLIDQSIDSFKSTLTNLEPILHFGGLFNPLNGLYFKDLLKSFFGFLPSSVFNLIFPDSLIRRLDSKTSLLEMLPIVHVCMSISPVFAGYVYTAGVVDKAKRSFERLKRGDGVCDVFLGGIKKAVEGSFYTDEQREALQERLIGSMTTKQVDDTLMLQKMGVFHSSKKPSQDRTSEEVDELLINRRSPINWTYIKNIGNETRNLLSIAFGPFITFKMVTAAIKFMNYFVQTIKITQKALHDISVFLNGNVVKLYNSLRDHPQLSGLIPELEELKVAVTKTDECSKEFTELLSLLNTKTFKEKPSLLISRKGGLFKCFKLLEACHKRLIPIVHAYATLDAKLSVVKLVKEYQAARKPCCFPKYLDPDESPRLEMHGFINPMIVLKDGETAAVPNNLRIPFDVRNGLGRVQVVGGVNAAGKSASAKGFMINVITGLSGLGIAFAESCTMPSSVGYMDTHLNITDDIGGGKSLHKAELTRLLEILRNVESVPEGQCSVVMFDELCNSTAPGSASAIARALVKHISNKHPRCLCTLISHYPEVTKLEKETAGVCKNYHFSAKKKRDESGKLVDIEYPYKMQEGAMPSDESTAIDMMEMMGFPEDIVKMAHEIYNQQLEAVMG